MKKIETKYTLYNGQVEAMILHLRGLFDNHRHCNSCGKAHTPSREDIAFNMNHYTCEDCKGIKKGVGND